MRSAAITLVRPCRSYSGPRWCRAAWSPRRARPCWCADRSDRRIHLDRNAFGKLREQRAIALAAERRDIALGRLAEIERRRFREGRGRSRKAQARTPPCPATRRGPSGSARQQSMSGLPRTASPMPRLARTTRRQIILELTLAGIALADPDPLAGRRLIDVEPGAGRELGQRADVGRHDPVAPRSNGTLKLRVSVKQRPPMRPVASTRVKLRPAAESLRAAAILAAPAPTMITSTSAAGPPDRALAEGGLRHQRGRGTCEKLCVGWAGSRFRAHGWQMVFDAAAQRTQSPREMRHF